MENISETIKKIKKEIDLIGSIETLSNIKKPDIIPFGIPTLDNILGVGGVPMGMITEIFGNPSSGKTSLTLQLIGSAQKRGIKCCYVDIELALNSDLAVKMGVDTDNLLVIRPLTGEEAFEVVEQVSKQGFGLVVVDSVAGLSAESELESDYDEQTIGLQARLVSKGMRKIIGCLHTNNTALVFINQIRAKMAKMPGAKTTTTSGGIAIPFYAALRLDMVRVGWLKDGEKITGMTIKVKTEKNKMYQPQLSTEFDFYFDTGFDAGTDLLAHLVTNGTITVLGRTYYHGDKDLGNKESAVKYVVENLK